mmetsp:Transcript_21478/g.59718  ORF Transcript_21478/g.59718 Transcript_21478/m.59718 type:complete len:219 (+) Transcript_21478:1864-2520(+)
MGLQPIPNKSPNVLDRILKVAGSIRAPYRNNEQRKHSGKPLERCTPGFEDVLASGHGNGTEFTPGIKSQARNVGKCTRESFCIAHRFGDEITCFGAAPVASIHQGAHYFFSLGLLLELPHRPIHVVHACLSPQAKKVHLGTPDRLHFALETIPQNGKNTQRLDQLVQGRQLKAIGVAPLDPQKIKGEILPQDIDRRMKLSRNLVPQRCDVNERRINVG